MSRKGNQLRKAGSSVSEQTQEKYLTVTQLSKYISAKFNRDPYLERVFVTGELSNFRLRQNGHQYFNLKDGNALIAAVMFKGQFSNIKFQPEEGMKVLVIGRVGTYEQRGTYQLYIEQMEPDGVGALHVAFEQLKKKLAAEGLFQFERQPIPRYPQKIAVVTSAKGAVIRDIITTVKRRYPIVQLVLYPTVVQGESAAANIVANLGRIEADGSYDTIIIGRGGGSIEDLWPFNEEAVVRAIAACKTPVISSVGHETDTTLADFVADQRAATPTAAAEIATPVLSEEIVRIGQLRQRLYQLQDHRLTIKKAQLAKQKQSFIFRQPERLYQGYRLNLTALEHQLVKYTQMKLKQEQQQLQQLTDQLQRHNPAVKVTQAKNTVQLWRNRLLQNQQQTIMLKRTSLNQLVIKLDMLSPLKRLSKGYAYVTYQGEPLAAIQTVNIGEQIKVTLPDGSLRANVTGITRQQLFNQAKKKEQQDGN